MYSLFTACHVTTHLRTAAERWIPCAARPTAHALALTPRAHAGYELVSVPYWEWDTLDTPGEKQGYLRRRLDPLTRRAVSLSEQPEQPEQPE